MQRLLVACLCLAACEPVSPSAFVDEELLSGPLPYRGVNLSVAEWGYQPDGSGVNGTFGSTYTYPDPSYVSGYNSADYFIGKGMTTFRLPFRWERLQPTRRAAFDAAELARLKATVNRLLGKGAAVLIDPHNYARYRGAVVGSSSLPNADFADLWTRLANEFKGNTNVLFGLMNEPYDLPTEQWVGAANAAIAAIRATGATNLILVPGNSWDSAMNWDKNFYGTPNAVAMLQIRDPLNHYAFEAHQYLDGNASGTDPACVSTTVGAERLVAFTNWLRRNGKKGFLGELGGGTSQTCLTALDNMLEHIETNQDVWLGWAFWAAGPWWGNSWYSLEPESGADKPQMRVLAAHLGKPLPPPTDPSTDPPPDPPPTTCSGGGTYEAESMTKSTGGATSGGWNIWANGYVSTSHTFAAGTTTIKVVAAGTPAAGVWPMMTLAVGGVSVGTASVNSGTYKEYSFSYNATAGQKTIRVEFTNDLLTSTEDRNLLVDKVMVGCSATVIEGCNGATGLIISTALSLDRAAVQAGQTLTGKVTYKNCGASAASLTQAVIAARPPGGSHSGGPYLDLAPVQGATTLPPGGTLTVTATRSFTASDPTGNWISYATYQDASGWHDGPEVAFSVGAPDPCAGASGLILDKALTLDKTSVAQGQSLGGSVTYKNCSSAAVNVQQIVIAGRPPGGTHAGGPYEDMIPVQDATSIPAGGTITLNASRSFTTADPAGTWVSFATYQDATGWHDGPDVSFTVTTSTTTPPSSSVPTDPISFQKGTPITISTGTTHYVFVPQSYDSTHQTPTTLFVWLHGCGGASSGDVWTASPGGTQQNWITLAPGGAEGGCWSLTNHPALVLAAIAKVKTHFNIHPKKVIIGGYSSGGNLTYRIAFHNASLFAGTLTANSSLFSGTNSSTALAAASWRFNIVHLTHNQDTTFPLSQARSETQAARAAGHPTTLIEREGTHWDNAGAIVNGQAVPGTSADIRTYLFPYLNAGWTAP